MEKSEVRSQKPEVKGDKQVQNYKISFLISDFCLLTSAPPVAVT